VCSVEEVDELDVVVDYRRANSLFCAGRKPFAAKLPLAPKPRVSLILSDTGRELREENKVAPIGGSAFDGLFSDYLSQKASCVCKAGCTSLTTTVSVGCRVAE